MICHDKASGILCKSARIDPRESFGSVDDPLNFTAGCRSRDVIVGVLDILIRQLRSEIFIFYCPDTHSHSGSLIADPRVIIK